MSFVVIASVMAASTVVSAVGQISAGKSQQIEMNRAAEEEKIAAESLELQRRQELNKVLAANNAALAAGNIGMEGTPSSIALSSAEQSSLSEGMAGLSSRLKQSQFKRQGATARSAGNLQAASTLLSGAAQIGQANAAYQSSKIT
tara:strand:- start:6 stop:440 length:435 start_codon:yes stop_codon:yes gene_type:complete